MDPNMVYQTLLSFTDGLFSLCTIVGLASPHACLTLPTSNNTAEILLFRKLMTC